jgi:C-terminal processing protease CtpA/Prc
LTIATYHTPSGNTPHLKGITPDVPVFISGDDRECFQKRCRIDSLKPEERASIESWQDPVIEGAIKAFGNP